MSKVAVLVKQLTALMKGDEPEVIAEAFAELGYQPKASAENLAKAEAAHKEALAKATTDAEQAAITKACEVINLCSLAEMPELAKAMVEKNVSVEESRTAIVNAKAAAAASISSTVGVGAGETVNYLIKDAELRAGN